MNDNLSYDEYELIKTKEGLKSKVKKTHTQSRPRIISDIELQLLIETYKFSFITKPEAMSQHQHNLLSALLDLEEYRFRDIETKEVLI